MDTKKIIGILAVIVIVVLTIVSVTSCGDSCDGGKKFDGDYKITQEKDSVLNDLNVYIENSGSMDGYVAEPMSTFKSTIFNLANNVENSMLNGDSKKVNLFYINSQIIPQENDLNSYIMTLNPSSFADKGGDRSTTDMADVIGKVVSKTNIDKGDASVLVSDFVFSPPTGSTPDYLSIQEGKITNVCNQFLNGNHEACVTVMKFSSFFKGKYIQLQRPFYMMIIGSRSVVAKIIKQVGSAQHAYADFEPKAINYGVINDKKMCDFQMCVHSKQRHMMHCDTKNVKGKKVFQFIVGVDFSKIPLSDDFLCNVKNYSFNNTNGKRYEIVSVTPKSNDENYTHLITVKYTGKGDIHHTTLEISLSRNYPDWIDASNCDSELPLLPDKTYGISSLFMGIKKAYDNSFSSASDKKSIFKGDNCYSKIRIIIDE
jgi:hypothetical protein